MSEDSRALPGTRATITLTGGETIHVRVTNRELIAWDTTRAQQKWPAWGEASFLALTFVTHRAALREQLTQLSWNEWKDAVEDIDSRDDETHPTTAGPAVD